MLCLSGPSHCPCQKVRTPYWDSSGSMVLVLSLPPCHPLPPLSSATPQPFPILGFGSRGVSHGWLTILLWLFGLTPTSQKGFSQKAFWVRGWFPLQPLSLLENNFFFLLVYCLFILLSPKFRNVLFALVLPTPSTVTGICHPPPHYSNSQGDEIDKRTAGSFRANFHNRHHFTHSSLLLFPPPSVLPPLSWFPHGLKQVNSLSFLLCCSRQVQSNYVLLFASDWKIVRLELGAPYLPESLLQEREHAFPVWEGLLNIFSSVALFCWSVLLLCDRKCPASEGECCVQQQY